MTNKFAVHHQTYKNRKALEFTIETFRKYFPNEKYRVVSDNGDDFSDLTHKFNIDFEFKNKNTFPQGRFQTIDNCYEWLFRIYETCVLYNVDWIVIFEDDVITQNSKIVFPIEDSAGMKPHRWRNELLNLLKVKNSKNKNWGYGMCGGSIFKRNAFLEAYNRINEFSLKDLSKLDNRIVGFSDCLLNCFLQYFGFSYEEWISLDDMTLPNHIYSKNACFIHGNKKFY